MCSSCTHSFLEHVPLPKDPFPYRRTRSPPDLRNLDQFRTRTGSSSSGSQRHATARQSLPDTKHSHEDEEEEERKKKTRTKSPSTEQASSLDGIQFAPSLALAEITQSALPVCCYLFRIVKERGIGEKGGGGRKEGRKEKNEPGSRQDMIAQREKLHCRLQQVCMGEGCQSCVVERDRPVLPILHP